MLIDSCNPRKILNALPSSIKILAGRSVNSLCALSMFTEILKKHAIQHEIQIVSEKIKITDNQYIVCIDTHQEMKNGMFFGARELMAKNNVTFIECTLTKDKPLISVMSMYAMARNMNFITERIVWPINVCISQYKPENDFYVDDENVENNIQKVTYKSFSDLKQMIELDTSKVKTITNINIFHIPFLKKSTLFESLSTIKTKYKIYDMLAYLGISLNEANQPFDSTSSHTKDTFNDLSSTETLFKSNETERLTPEENYYNMIYYLSQERYTDALLCLENICYKGKRIYECIKMIEHTKMKKINGINLIFIKKKINLKNRYLLLNIVYENVKSKCEAIIYDNEEKVIVTDKKINEENLWKRCYKIDNNSVRKCIEYLAYLN